VRLDSSAFGADRELLVALAKRSARVVYDEERILFHQGEWPTGLYILRTGTATLTMSSHTGETILRASVSSGALLGLPAFIGDQPYSLTAIAHKGAELGFVNRKDFSEMMLTCPTLSLKVLSVLAAEVHTARVAISEF
jgi:CRP/FNR family transcriptional regulator